MKTTAKVFLIIGMVLGFYAVFPLIFGVKTINRLNCARHKSQLTAWGVLSIIFVSIIGGILVLCIPQKELDKNPTPIYQPNINPNYELDNKKENKKIDYIQNIKELKELYDCGAINEQEYQKLKAEMLSNN